MKTRTATFQHDAGRETKVRIIIEDQFTSFSIMETNAEDAVIVQKMRFSPLVLTEAFQFIADVTAEEVNGRLSPFVRGWIGTASDVYALSKSMGYWQDGIEYDGDEAMLHMITAGIGEAVNAVRAEDTPAIEAALATTVLRIMDLSHARGWDIARTVEAEIKHTKGG